MVSVRNNSVHFDKSMSQPCPIIQSAEVYAECGVRVNAICSTLTKTELINEAVGHHMYPEEKLKELLEDKLRAMSVDEVADALMKLELGDYNGSSMVFTKEGIQALDEKERLAQFVATMYDRGTD